MKMISPHLKKKRIESGFTLLEVIVGISILTFGILAVASMQISAIRGNAFARDVTEASTLVGDQLEFLMTLGWNDALLVDTGGNGTAGLGLTGAAADHQAGAFPPPHDKYTIFWNIADDLPSSTKILSVIATWSDHGLPKRFEARSMITQL
jgi:prepilin-type N-terminal cleavage/methylation domain-containing protein